MNYNIRLRIIARLFKDNQLVGYRVTDGIDTRDMNKAQAWLYAKNGAITNVTAVGTMKEPSISGINGFELKKLPTINLESEENRKCANTNNQIPKRNKFQIYEDSAARVYNITKDLKQQEMQEVLNREKPDYMDNLRKSAIRDMLFDAGYKEEDLPELLAKTPGRNAEQKTRNLIKYLKKAAKTKAKAEDIRVGIRIFLDALGFDI